MIEWTDERVATLRKMVTDGETVATIAAAFRLSPGSVSGKIFRLGLCTPRNEQWGKGRVKKIQSRERRELQSSQLKEKRESDAQDLRAKFACTEIIDLAPEQSSTAATFFEIGDHQCKWPVSGNARDLGTMLFCGTPSDDDGPWCEHHARMAYQPRVYRPKYMQAAE